MCGIAGIVSSRVKENGFLHRLLSGWEALLRHRGPDGWGWYRCAGWPVLLFHRRLAITGVNNGRQPVPNERRNVWLTFNGEIYNHAALRRVLEARGHHFSSDSDGEVIVHLYETSGMQALRQLQGDFAFALYDAVAGKVFLVRDRFGVKPLYYAFRNGELHFSSEIKGIFADPAFPRVFDPETLQNKIQTFYFGTDTIFQDVRQLAPGHYLCFDLNTGTIQLFPYWQLAFDKASSKTPEKDLVDEFSQRFRSAVQMRIPEEVRFGAYLSGGLDSAAITRTMADVHPASFPVFSIGFANRHYNELPHTTALVRALDVPQHVVWLKKGDLKNAFLKSLWHSEIPVLNTHGAAKHILAGLARQHCSVVLTGEGADELLMGYSLFSHLQRQEANADTRATEVAVLRGQLSGKLKQYDSVVRFFGAYPYAMHRHFYLQNISRFLLAGQYRQVSQKWEWQQAMSRKLHTGTFTGLNSLQATQQFFLQADFPAYLLNYLGDRQEMSAGLEGRVPFLDHTLAEFIAALPVEMKLRGDTGKYILREAMRGHLEEPLRNRPKQVFYAPAFESLDYFDDPDFFKPFTSLSKFQEVAVFNPWFYTMLAGLIRVLPPGNRFLPVAESVATFVLSLHIVHDFFVRDFDTWQKHYAPLDDTLNWPAQDAARWYRNTR
ncbi:MAG: asparagine synthase (glutamine-hydrolyzing) [Bacteroidetes bacterium]|nr:MAG: asparagine synthase (glutamine-hydrolyzing) [Bacteroidota bacterium]